VFALLPLTRDGWLLVATYSLRLFGYGFLAVILALYLASLGFSSTQIGVVFAAAVGGAAVLTGGLAWIADRVGRRRVLAFSALLMAIAGAMFATTDQFPLLLIAAAIGSFSPSGSEVGPFLSLEQAMLPRTTDDQNRTRVFSAYNVIGQSVGAAGAAVATVPTLLGMEQVAGYRALTWAYAVIGLLLAVFFWSLSDQVEIAETPERRKLDHGRIGGRALTFTGLYALDSLGSGFVAQGLVFYWFNLRYGIDVKGLAAIAVGTDVLAALSFAAAPWLAARVGLLLAAILPHVIANVVVIAVPLMPTWQLAVGAWLTRYAFAQMERPARQSYTMAVLPEEQRVPASGIMSVARNAAASIAPAMAGTLYGMPGFGVPFLIAGAVKLIYDGALFLQFRDVQPPEEHPETTPT
jgi:MFS family permease